MGETAGFHAAVIALQDVGSALEIDYDREEIVGARDFYDVELSAIFVAAFVEKSVARDERNIFVIATGHENAIWVGEL